MMQSIGSSCGSILTLSDNAGLPVKDCYLIARATIEGAINVTYIIAAGEEMAARAWRHAMQKSYRDRQRQSSIGDITIQLRAAEPEVTNDSELTKALAEFTHKSGREKRDWTDDNLEERLKLIGKKYGEQTLTPLHVAQFAIYRHASEMAHSTFFGALHFLDPRGLGPNQPKEQSRLTIQDHLLLILFNVFSANDSMITAFSKTFSTPTFGTQSRNLFDEIYTTKLFQDNLH